jgi:hypothetical protein
MSGEWQAFAQAVRQLPATIAARLNGYVVRVETPSPCIICGAPPTAYADRIGGRYGFCQEHAATAAGHGLPVKRWQP